MHPFLIASSRFFLKIRMQRSALNVLQPFPSSFSRGIFLTALPHFGFCWLPSPGVFTVLLWSSPDVARAFGWASLEEESSPVPHHIALEVEWAPRAWWRTASVSGEKPQCCRCELHACNWAYEIREVCNLVKSAQASGAGLFASISVILLSFACASTSFGLIDSIFSSLKLSVAVLFVLLF